MEPDGSYAPAETFGFGVFSKMPTDQANALRRDLGAIGDAIQSCHDEIEVTRLSNDLPFNFGPRFNKYALHFRNKLFAERMRGECMTIQVKLISNHQITNRHRDDKNCVWVGYEKTSALCIVFADAFGHIWSVKILINSRSSIGEYFNGKLGLGPMFTRIQNHVDSIDRSFRLIHSKQLFSRSKSHAPGSQLQYKLPTYLTFYDLILDDFTPWMKKKIGTNPKNGEDILADMIEMPANVVRDFFLSPACTIIHRVKLKLSKTCPDAVDANDRKLVELAIMCAYQTSFCRFYHVGKDNINRLTSESPCIAMYQLLKETFGTITGTSGCRRMNPSGIKFEQVFLNEKGEGNGTLAKVVQAVMMLLDGINSLTGSGKFTQMAIEELVRGVCNEWSGTGIDIDEIRIMIVVQVLVLSGIIVRPHSDLLDLVYPVATSGAGEQLAHIDADKRPDVVQRITQQFRLRKFGASSRETVLCETEHNRAGRIFERLLRGIDLFYLNENGTSMLKPYGGFLWTSVWSLDCS